MIIYAKSAYEQQILNGLQAFQEKAFFEVFQRGKKIAVRVILVLAGSVEWDGADGKYHECPK